MAKFEPEQIAHLKESPSYAFRNKCEFSFGHGAKGQPELGFIERVSMSKFVVQKIQENNRIVHPVIYQVAEQVKRVLMSAFPVFDRERRTGLLRNVSVRMGRDGLCSLVVKIFHSGDSDDVSVAVVSKLAELDKAFMSALNAVHLGNSFSLRGLSRLGSGFSISAVIDVGRAISVLDFGTIGSSLSIRSVAIAGSEFSAFNTARLGRTVSAVDAGVLPSGLSLRGYGRLGCNYSVGSWSVAGATLSVTGLTSLGSSVLVKSFSRLGSSQSVFAKVLMGDNISVLDSGNLASSVSLARYARIGSELSISNRLRV